MKIDLHKITIRKVIAKYQDSAEEGVTAYDGKLNVRPKYQREFVYKEKQRNAVIETIQNGFPLNVMYWMISRKEENLQSRLCLVWFDVDKAIKIVNKSLPKEYTPKFIRKRDLVALKHAKLLSLI